MKTALAISRPPRRSRAGSAVLVVLVLLAFMLALAAANTVTLNALHKRVKLVDQRQTRRLATLSTNAAPAAGSVTNLPSSR
jgi:hypothetical protein